MKSLIPCLALLLAAVQFGCDSNDPATTEGEVAEIRITPESADIAVGELVDFSLVALTATGDTAQGATLDVRWWSTDSTVFSVNASGEAVGQDPGTALCMVEVTELAKAGARFTGKDSAFVRVFLP